MSSFIYVIYIFYEDLYNEDTGKEYAANPPGLIGIVLEDGTVLEHMPTGKTYNTQMRILHSIRR